MSTVDNAITTKALILSVVPAGRIFILFAASCRQAARDPVGVLVMFMLLL
jgi:hypothetical protein